jgi:hypothetical protein
MTGRLILLNLSIVSLMIGVSESRDHERRYGRQRDADEYLFHDNLHFVLGAAG